MSSGAKRVLVFGATGEIGSRVARGCVEEGHAVTGVSRGQNARHRVDLKGMDLITGDKGDEEFVKSLASGKEFDVVVDTVPTSAHVDLVFKHFNGRIQHYFMCSSTGTFVPLRELPADESHPWREKTDVNFHDQSVRDAHALEIWEAHGLPVTIFRPTNIIGAGRIPLETWGGRSIEYWRRVKEGRPVEIPENGNILLQSGCNEDLATAFVTGVGKAEEIAGEIFIISTRKAVTLDRYLSAGKEVLNSSSPVETVSMDELMRRYPEEATQGGLRFLVEHMCFDISKAESLLGYSPRFSTEQGLAKALEWCLDEKLL